MSHARHKTDAPEVHKLGQVTAHSDHDSFEAEELACEVFVVVRVPPRATVVACRWVGVPKLSERAATPNTGRRGYSVQVHGQRQCCVRRLPRYNFVRPVALGPLFAIDRSSHHFVEMRS